MKFLIWDIVHADSKWFVDGRCCQGPILIGDAFHHLCEVKIERMPDGEFGDTTLIPMASVELKVESIMAYWKFLPELSEGWTGRIELTGAGLEKLQKDFSLT